MTDSLTPDALSKHTPGPWSITRGYTKTGYPCFWINGMSADEKRDAPTLDADARLIAEAPELLEALRELLASDLAQFPPYEAGKEAQDTWSHRRAAARNNARDAIVKATGAI
jgi:hypothetical protein